jgi:RNA polymerase II elongation factor ELL
MSYDIARQRLSERSQIFKSHYAKYRKLHKSLEGQANPSQADLEKLVKQHEHLQSEKREIWEEDRRLREGIRA